MSRVEILFRRSPHIVSYWADGKLVFRNYVNGRSVSASPLATEILDFFDDWREPEPLFSKLATYSRSSLRRALALLVKHSLLERSDRGPSPTEHAMESWADWNPEAGLLHFTTKDRVYLEDRSEIERLMVERSEEVPVPPPLKKYPESRAVPLPPPDARDEFSGVLLARRTWRRFSRRALDRDALGQLLGLTFGVQAWLYHGELGRLPLKTSPSGGALHPIEAYLVVRRVRQLAAGIYHYDPDGHQLNPIRAGASSRTLGSFLPAQPGYRSAAALVLMTAVFPRKQWKYRHPGAYRSVLLEAGHFCQTFCLVATSLGLAPFCTAALAHSRIERELGIDGVSESVMYATGVGHRPDATDWAPIHEKRELPPRDPPKWKRRRRV